MQYETIKYKKENGYAMITLNRPEALNALNDVVMRELCDVLEDIEQDDGISTFILTGAPRADGRPCFSAGGDLKAAGNRSEEAKDGSMHEMPSPLKMFWQHQVMRPSTTFDMAKKSLHEMDILSEIFRRVTWSPKISIAAVDGVCTAGGLELALACDIILVSETAQMSDLHVKNLGRHGLAVGAPLAYRVGVSRAIELMCMGDIVDGNEAYRIGLANHVYPPDRLIPEAKALAQKLGSRRPAALSVAKALARSIWEMDRYSTFIFNQEASYALSLEPDADQWGPKRWLSGETRD